MSKTDTDGKRRTRSTSIFRCPGSRFMLVSQVPSEAVERAGREHQEEVRAEAVPLDLAELSTSASIVSPATSNASRSPSLRSRSSWYSDATGHVVLAAVGFRPPAARHDLVVESAASRPRTGSARARRSPAPCSVAGLISSIGLPLMADMRARIIGNSARRRQPAVLDEPGEVARLGVGDVDHEVVRRVGRQARAPGLEQVAAHDGEEQQHHEPEPECDHLHDALAPAACQVRDAIAPGDADRAAQATGEAHQQVARAVEHGERPADADRDVDDEPRVAHQPEQDADERRDSEAVRQRSSAAAAVRGSCAARAPAARASTAAWAAARSRRGSRVAVAAPSQAGASVGGGRSARTRSPRSRVSSSCASSRAQRRRPAADQCDQRELDHRHLQHEALRRAHALHERDAVEVALRVARAPPWRPRSPRAARVIIADRFRKRPARRVEDWICGLSSATPTSRSPFALRSRISVPERADVGRACRRREASSVARLPGSRSSVAGKSSIGIRSVGARSVKAEPWSGR